ncbi:MAG TPA: hypothetical protein VN612_10240 [Acidobacteriaceae bacterium]|jgi:hypothetical protein|nr:hypothetical protein [Acidobacteriaceae bacterium]
MNPITFFVAVICVLLAAAFGTWFNRYLAVPDLVAAAFIALSLKSLVTEDGKRLAAIPHPASRQAAGRERAGALHDYPGAR